MEILGFAIPIILVYSILLIIDNQSDNDLAHRS